MIENFNDRYKKLLNLTKQDAIEILDSVESRGGYSYEEKPIITSKADIDCAEGAFIEMFCL